MRASITVNTGSSSSCHAAQAQPSTMPRPARTLSLAPAHHAPVLARRVQRARAIRGWQQISPNAQGAAQQALAAASCAAAHPLPLQPVLEVAARWRLGHLDCTQGRGSKLGKCSGTKDSQGARKGRKGNREWRSQQARDVPLALQKAAAGAGKAGALPACSTSDAASQPVSTHKTQAPHCLPHRTPFTPTYCYNTLVPHIPNPAPPIHHTPTQQPL